MTPNWLLRFKFYVASLFTPNKLQRNPTPMDKNGYELTFFDDFIGTELDLTKWTPTNETNYFSAFPWMYFSKDCVTVKDSCLNLLAKNEPIHVDGKDFQYQIGYATTNKSISQTQGYFEIRCNIPKALGSWPAFWMLTESMWPPEIDMFEFFQSNSVPRNLSYSLNWQENQTNNKAKTANSQIWIKTLWEGFNVYGFEWDKNSLKLYVNGFLVDVNTNQEAIDVFNKYKWYVILDNFVTQGGNGKIGFNENTFSIDYLKVYKKI